MAEEKKSEGLEVSGFTLGVLSIIFAGWIGLIVSIFGFIFCMVQQKRHKTRLGKIGIILSIIGAVLSIAVIVLYAKYIGPLLNQVPAA
jgi:hypothetical protein